MELYNKTQYKCVADRTVAQSHLQWKKLPLQCLEMFLDFVPLYVI